MQYKAISERFRPYLHHFSTFKQASPKHLFNVSRVWWNHPSNSTNIVFPNFFLEMLRCFLGPPSPWLCNAGSNSSVTRRRMPSSGSALKTTLQRWPTFAHLGVPFDKELMNWFFVWQGYELGRALKWSGHWWIQSPFASFSHAFFANSCTWCLIL